ncbi:MAG: hypothetical protein ACI3VB_04255 [Oscillospiraceae bacterium]
MTIKQISVFVSNMTGGLAEVTEAIRDSDIDVRALSIADTTDFGILRLIVNDPDKALSVLKDAGFIVSVTDVLAARIDDCPGGLSKVLRILADENIAIEYVYAFAARNRADSAYVVIRLEDNDHAGRVLEENGVKLLSSDEIYNI